MMEDDILFIKKRIEILTQEKRELRKMIAELTGILKTTPENARLTKIFEDVYKDLRNDLEDVIINIHTLNLVIEKETT